MNHDIETTTGSCHCLNQKQSCLYCKSSHHHISASFSSTLRILCCVVITEVVLLMEEIFLASSPADRGESCNVVAA
ncbi:hypothetical protein RchiOBHm_Chr4g0413901 [Rosa chinensis]|uniref:Uncharacterized protein n=1 Tax=Rosa chinensis TaxID=74649 RepID=A0A2P6QW93_ROSCH|nr:hypothetical protein RchiOBHm_Chr4g0413901 [Rosa chinensis]